MAGFYWWTPVSVRLGEVLAEDDETAGSGLESAQAVTSCLHESPLNHTCNVLSDGTHDRTTLCGSNDKL